MEYNFTYKANIRFFDIDINNHVNNSVYFTLMEEARTKLLIDQYNLCKAEGIHFVVVEANCKYKRPILLGDDITINIIIKFNKTASFDINYNFINNNGTLHAEGYTKMACFDYIKQRPVKIPDSVIRSF